MPGKIPNSLQALAREIEAWISFGCPERALVKLERLLDSPIARPTGLALEVRALIEMTRYDEALTCLHELRGIATDEQWLEVTEGWCHKRLGDLQAAIGCMQRLIGRCPRSAVGHFNLGCYLALSGKIEPAIDEVTLACGIDPNFRTLAANETDLLSLSDHPRFLELLPKNPPQDLG